MSRNWLFVLGAIGLEALATPVTVRAHNELGAPQRLWVAPVDQLQDRNTWLALEPRTQARMAIPKFPLTVDDYQASLAPGRYALVGFNPPGFVVGTRETASALRAARDLGEEFLVPEGGAVTLGQIEVFVGGSLGLIFRDGPSNPAWVLADTDAEDPLVRRLRARVRWTSVPSETSEGGWLVLASGNRLALADAQHHWRVFPVLAGGFPQIATMAGTKAIAVGGHGPQFEWLPLDGRAIPMTHEGLPQGAVVALHCDASARCAVAIRAPDNRTTLAYSADARKHAWKTVVQLDSESCGWAIGGDCAMPAQVHRIGDALVGISDGTRLVSVELATGAGSDRKLADKGRGSYLSDGRLVVGKQISSDGGKTWSKLQGSDELAQRSADGSYYKADADGGIRFKVPVSLRRGADDKGWSDNARLPAFGTYVVGLQSARQYLRAGTEDNLWTSTDGGRNWSADHALIEALAGTEHTP